MAQINEKGQEMTWQNLGLDKYLRQQSAPVLYDSPLTIRAVLGGAQTIQQSGNVMPQSVTRDKLGKDALVFPLNINVGSYIVQAATGYTSALNNYIYVATWDTVNYKIMRFNTVNLLAPYQDAYILNTGIGLANSEAVSSIDAITVTDNNVIVAYTTNGGMHYAALLGFDLTYSSRVAAPTADLALDAGADYDGHYLNSLCNMASGGGIDQQQLQLGSALGLTNLYPNPFNFSTSSYYYQTFTTGPNTTSITKVSFVINAGSNAGQGGFWLISDAARTTNLGGGSYFATTTSVFQDQTPSGGPITVTPNTTYCLIIYDDGNYSLGSSWYGSSTRNYSNGQAYYYNGSTAAAQTGSFAFKIWTAPPSGYSGKRIVQFNPPPYALVSSTAWTPTNFPTQLAGWDGTFHYAYDSVNKNIVKFQISGGAIVVATTTPMLESVYGVFNFSEFIFIIALIGSQLVAIPVTI